MYMITITTTTKINYETLSDTYIVWFKVGLGVPDRIV